MRWEGCTVVVHDAAGKLVCEDEDVDLDIALPGEADGVDAADGVDEAPPEGAISILYWDEEGALAYSGSIEPDGSFRLTCRSRPRKATLAWSEDRSRLEGTWEDAEQRGSWRVDLAPRAAQLLN